MSQWVSFNQYRFTTLFSLYAANLFAIIRVNSRTGCYKEAMANPYALIVEDEPLVAELFQRALQDAGYQAEIMDNGHKAQAQLVFTSPEIVLLDMNLPSISGSVLLRQIRGQHRLSGTHVVVVTNDKESAKSLADEADQVLVKPVGYEQVREVAERYLHPMV